MRSNMSSIHHKKMVYKVRRYDKRQPLNDHTPTCLHLFFLSSRCVTRGHFSAERSVPPQETWNIASVLMMFLMAGPGSVDRGERLENETITPWTHNLNTSWDQWNHSGELGTSPLAVTSSLIPDVANSTINVTGNINFNTTAIPPTPGDEAVLSDLQLFGIIFVTLTTLFLFYVAMTVWYVLHQCIIDCNSAACEANVRGPVLRGATRCQKVLGCLQACRWICCFGYCRVERRSDATDMQQTIAMVPLSRFFHRFQRPEASRHLFGFQSLQSRLEDSPPEDNNNNDNNIWNDPEQPGYAQPLTPPSMFRDATPSTHTRVNNGVTYSPLPRGSVDELLKPFLSKVSRLKRDGYEHADEDLSVYLDSDQYSVDSTFVMEDPGYLTAASVEKSSSGPSDQLTVLGNDGDDDPHVVGDETDVPSSRSQTYSLHVLSRTSVQSHQRDRFSLDDADLSPPSGESEESGSTVEYRCLRPAVGTGELLRGTEFTSEYGSNDSIDVDSNPDRQADAKRACVVEIFSEKHIIPTSSLWTGDSTGCSPAHKSASCHTLDERAARRKRTNNLHFKAESITVLTSACKEPVREKVIPIQDPSPPQSEAVVQVPDQPMKCTEVSSQLLADEQKPSPDEDSAENTSGYSEMSETELNDSGHLSSLCKHHSRFHSDPCLGEKSFITKAEDPKKAQTDAVEAGRAVSSEVVNRGMGTPVTRYPPGSRGFKRSPAMGVSGRLKAAGSLELPGAQVTDHRHCVKCFPQNQPSTHCSHKTPQSSQASASRERAGHALGLLNATYTIHRPGTTSSAGSVTEESPQHETSSRDLKKTDPSNAGKSHDKALDDFLNQSVTKDKRLPVDTSTCDSKSGSQQSPDLPGSNPSSRQHVPKIMSSLRTPQTNASPNTQTNTFRDNLVKKFKDKGSFFPMLVSPYLRLPTSPYPASPRITVSETGRQPGNVARDLTTVHNVVDRQPRAATQCPGQAQRGAVHNPVSVAQPSPDETLTHISSQPQDTSDADLD